MRVISLREVIAAWLNTSQGHPAGIGMNWSARGRSVKRFCAIENTPLPSLYVGVLMDKGGDRFYFRYT